MKFRTDFVTNSSSSGFVAINNLESKTLDNLLNDAEINKETFEGIISELNDMEYGVDIESNTSETLCVLLDTAIDFEYGTELDEGICDKMSALKETIRQYSDEINGDVDIELETGSASSESQYLTYSKLSLKEGKGEYIYSHYSGYGDIEPSFYDNYDIIQLGDKSYIDKGNITNKEAICSDDFIYFGTYLSKYQGDKAVENLIIPFKNDTIILDRGVFNDLDGYYWKQDQKLKTVTISEGVSRFEDNGELNEFRFTYIFPASLTSVDIHCDLKKVTISAPAGCYAETYAKENGYTFVPLTE